MRYSWIRSFVQQTLRWSDQEFNDWLHGGWSSQFSLRDLLLAFIPIALIALPLGHFVRRQGLPRTVPVSGTVTLDGVPIDGVGVVFRPTTPNGLLASGETNTAGSFQLRTEVVRQQRVVIPGAVVGSYVVFVVPDWHHTPEQFRTNSSPKTEITKTGPNNFAFKFTSP
jgi:hypothetical protein